MATPHAWGKWRDQQKAGASHQVLIRYHKLNPAITLITAAILETAPLHWSELSKPPVPAQVVWGNFSAFFFPDRKGGDV